MSTVQDWTPDRAEAYFNGSLIGQVSAYLAEAMDEIQGRRRGVAIAAATRPPIPSRPADAGQPERPRPGFFERLEAKLWRQEQKRREAWLAESHDIFELEERIRRLDRGRTGL